MLVTSTALNFPGDGMSGSLPSLVSMIPILKQFPANEPSIPLDAGGVDPALRRRDLSHGNNPRTDYFVVELCLL